MLKEILLYAKAQMPIKTLNSCCILTKDLQYTYSDYLKVGIYFAGSSAMEDINILAITMSVVVERH